jgi:hypothetical protein
MPDWDALERADEDRLVSRISDAWRDVARDHKTTFRMLTMHPEVERIIVSDHDNPQHIVDSGSEPNDPTGEAAVHDRLAVKRQEIYSRFLAEIAARVDVLDVIRRQMMPAREAPPITDDQWCKNCITAGVCKSRKDRYHYCWWCLDVRQTYGALPPANIVKLRDETGDSARVAKALADWRKRQ